MRLRLAGMALAIGMAAPGGAIPPPPPVEGMWINPHGSVAVRTGACRGGLCGWIVWASDAAKADARDAGIDPLIGTELLQDYRAAGDRHWAGTVFVPDLGRRFASTIEPVGAGALKVRGCVIGNVFCKSQIWRRIDRVPHA